MKHAMRSLLVLVPFLALACTSHEPPTTGTTPTAPTAAVVQLRGAISSVNLVDDCPDPPDATPSAAVPAQPITADRSAAKIAPGAARTPGEGRDSFGPSCTQSTVQLSFAHDGRTALPIAIAEVRLVTGGKAVSKVPVRGPQRWQEAGGYAAWDQSVPAATEVKASYRLGAPDWSAPELGGDGYGKDLVLEVDVVFDGRTITLRSATFQRERPHVVVT